MYASGRNYLGSFLGLVTGIGLMSAAQNKGLMDSIQQMYDGVSQVVQGATSAWQIIAVIAAPIITPILARFASNSAKVDNQSAALVAAAKDPNTDVSKVATANLLEAAAETAPLADKIKVTDKALAEAVPSNMVVAK